MRVFLVTQLYLQFYSSRIPGNYTDTFEIEFTEPFTLHDYIERIYQNSNPCRLKLFCWYSWKGKSLKIIKFLCSLLNKENFLNSKRHKVVRLKYQIRNNLKLEGLSLLYIRVFIVHLYKKHAIRSFVIFLSMTNMTLNFPYKK